jgi:hypothetical protein
MLRADSSASMKLVLGLYEQMRNIQERLNDATISNWALLTALAEKDEAFADVYLAHKEKTEASELGQTLASTLRQMDQLLARMRADLGL